MFIDYLALMLLNVMAGYFLLACYVLAALDHADQTRWAPGFLMTGFVALAFGAVMSITWPLPGAYSAAYGGMSVLFGIIFLGAGLAMAKGWDLLPVAYYAFFAGWAAVLIGVRIIHLKLTLAPLLSGCGFILSGLGGVLAAPTLRYLKANRPFRAIAALVLVAAGVIWGTIAYAEYWHQMQQFGAWVPLLMRGAHGQP